MSNLCCKCKSTPPADVVPFCWIHLITNALTYRLFVLIPHPWDFVFEWKMEDVESRFAHLLQPIRELTKNWEIDVASQLEEYLEEVNSLLLNVYYASTRYSSHLLISNTALPFFLFVFFS